MESLRRKRETPEMHSSAVKVDHEVARSLSIAIKKTLWNGVEKSKSHED